MRCKFTLHAVLSIAFLVCFLLLNGPEVILLSRLGAVVWDALVNGAKGYVEEAAPVSEFVSAIRVVNQGLIWAPRRVMGILIIRYSQGRTGLFGERITMREREVLEMLVAGRSNREIARPLGIAERTVKSHVAKLMRKVGVQNRIALSMHAVKHSLVAWDEPKSATSPTNQAVQ